MKDSPVWTGDLNDDCTARWHGLILRAEMMQPGEWWWAVYMDQSEEDSVWNNHGRWPLTGKRARRAAEAAACRLIRKYAWAEILTELKKQEDNDELSDHEAP